MALSEKERLGADEALGEEPEIELPLKKKRTRKINCNTK
jgi:hypothetical protein